LSYTSTNFSLVPALDDTDGYAEFVALFDQYRMIEYEVTMLPSTNTADVVGVGTAVLPYIWYCNDSDGNGPTTAAEFLERGTQPKLFDRALKLRNRSPGVLTEVVAGAGTGYAPTQSKVWIDTGDADCPHYGSYFLVDGTRVAGWTARVYVTVLMEFRGVR
jgi:hypothetical protein